jgi:glycosyltransferase involved in cell wall biosynthesis
MIVGPGSRFLSGIGYHAASIARSFQRRDESPSVLLIRQLCPTRAYPGRDRVGRFDPSILGLVDIECHEGLDWYWGLSLRRALRFLRRRRPEVVLFQWWTAVTAHSYLVLAREAQRLGARVVFEMHEVSDVGEAALPLVGTYTRTMMAALARHIDGVIVHSSADAKTIPDVYPYLAQLPTAVIFPGPLEHGEGAKPLPARQRAAGEAVRLLFFGVIRPYKGIDELAQAFCELVADGVNVHLTVAGESWDDAALALDRIRSTGSRHHTITSGYVADEEVNALFEAADVVVAPYRRAAASGPINLTMATGMPLVTTLVPALVEACRDYEGAEFAVAGDAASLRAAIDRSLGRVGERYANPHSWDANVEYYRAFFDGLGRAVGPPSSVGSAPSRSAAPNLASTPS